MATRCWNAAARTMRSPAINLTAQRSNLIKPAVRLPIQRHVHISRFIAAAAPQPIVPAPAASVTSVFSDSSSSSGHANSSSSDSKSSGSSSGGESRGRSWSTRIGITFFLSTAAFAVYLGTWLIDRRTAALNAPPLDLVAYLDSHPSLTSSTPATPSAPQAGSTLAPSSSGSSNPSDVLLSDEDECRRMTACGRFLYDRTQLLGPRTPPSGDGTSTAGQGVGYFLLTPFRLSNGRIVLVNRGWCPKDKCTPNPQSNRANWESGDKGDEELEFVGVMRKGEAEPQFLSAYDPEQTGSFIWLDLPRMAQFMGISGGAETPSSAASSSSVSPPPVLLDALEVRGSNPVRFMRRRVAGDYVIFTTTPMIHTVYAATWFTLSAALVALTYIRFKRRIAMPARKTNAPIAKTQ